MKPLINFLLLVIWVGGIVIAKGFWSTFFAVVVPLWAWYMVIEQAVIKYLL